MMMKEFNEAFHSLEKPASRTGGVGVVGSNPIAPTNKIRGLAGNG